jgi:hypothetical protein
LTIAAGGRSCRDGAPWPQGGCRPPDHALVTGEADTVELHDCWGGVDAMELRW